MSPHWVPNIRIIGLRALLSVLAVALGTIASLAPAFAAANGTWAVEPSGPPDEPLSRRGAFFYELVPGQTLTDWVSVQNLSDSPMSFFIFGADAYNLPDGTWALTEIQDRTEHVGSWIGLGEAIAVTIEPKKEHRIPFTITSPEDAAPGDYAGGIVVLNQEVEGVLEGETSVGVQRAVGTRMYVRVAGPVRPAMVVTDMSTAVVDRLSFDGGDVATTYTLKNIGNMRLSPTVTVSAESLSGSELYRSEPLQVPVLLPGETATLQHVWNDLPFLDLATVRVVANHEKVVAAASSNVLLASPLVWLAIVAVGLLIGTLVVRRRRRLRARATLIDVELVGADQ